jgi:hypothetical protein
MHQELSCRIHILNSSPLVSLSSVEHVCSLTHSQYLIVDILPGLSPLFTPWLGMSACTSLARMSMTSLLVSIVEFLTLFSLSASHFKPLLFHLTFALRLALSAVYSVRGDLRCYVSSEGCLWETTYRAPLPWQVRANLPVPWWDRLAGKSSS